MKFIGVIPARYQSQRFPGKPLALIDNKPLLQWVVEGCLKSQKLSELFVATDDERIFDLAKSLPVTPVMTSPEHLSGSDRVWEVAQKQKCDVVINIQGDEPHIQGVLIDELASCFEKESIEMASVMGELKKEELEDPNTVKVVVNNDNHAIYFSRFPIPHSRKQAEAKCESYKHIGIYSYQLDFLKRFCEVGPTELERCEGLEQLRALALGGKIKMLYTEQEFQGVDVPEDIAKVKKL